MGIIITVICVISLLYSAAAGSADKLSSAVAGSALDAAELSVTLAASMAFWSGMMKVAEKSGAVDKVCRTVRPVLRFLMPDLGNDSKALKAASLNLTANLLGIGNAATPLGLRAMRELEREGARRRTVSLFVLLNTSSVQLLPMTVISLRARAGSVSPADCMLPVLVNSFAALSCGMIMLFVFYGGKQWSSSHFQPH